MYNKSLVVAAALAISTTALAQDLTAPNATNGQIVLTQSVCHLPTAPLIIERYVRDGEPLLYAYSLNNEGKVEGEACYFIPKIPYQDAASVKDKGVLVPVVNLIPLVGGRLMIIPRLLNEFTPYKKDTV